MVRRAQSCIKRLCRPWVAGAMSRLSWWRTGWCITTMTTMSASTRRRATVLSLSSFTRGMASMTSAGGMCGCATVVVAGLIVCAVPTCLRCRTARWTLACTSRRLCSLGAYVRSRRRRRPMAYPSKTSLVSFHQTFVSCPISHASFSRQRERPDPVLPPPVPRPTASKTQADCRRVRGVAHPVRRSAP